MYDYSLTEHMCSGNIPLAMGPIQGLYRTSPHISEAFPVVKYHLNEWEWCCTCFISPSASPCKYAPSKMNIARAVVAHQGNV